MKKYSIYTFIIILLITHNTSAQTIQSGEQPYFKHAISLETSIFSGSSNPNFGVGSSALEYTTYINRKLSWSIEGRYANWSLSLFSGGTTLDENFYSISGKVNYNFRIAGEVIFLRVGLGIGLGVHDPIRFEWGDIDRLPENHEIYEINNMKTKIFPHLIANISWVFRAGKNAEITVSPLFLSPSWFLYSPWSTIEPYNDAYYAFDYIKIGYARRF